MKICRWQYSAAPARMMSYHGTRRTRPMRMFFQRLPGFLRSRSFRLAGYSRKISAVPPPRWKVEWIHVLNGRSRAEYRWYSVKIIAMAPTTHANHPRSVRYRLEVSCFWSTSSASFWERAGSPATDASGTEAAIGEPSSSRLSRRIMASQAQLPQSTSRHRGDVGFRQCQAVLLRRLRTVRLQR